MSVLVERLKERLEACGINASRASLETGFGRQCIRDVIVGKSKSPSVAFVEAAARVLNCSVAYLIGETDELHTVSYDSAPFSSRSDQPDDIIPARNNKLTSLRDEIETAYDLLTALDKTGDGIGGDVGHGVSAVALAARAALDNARSMLKAMEASR